MSPHQPCKWLPILLFTPGLPKTSSVKQSVELSGSSQLSPQALEDLQWWEPHLSTWNGRSLITQSTSLTITSEASLQGWGATCNGNQTRGPWSPSKQSLLISCLELLAATLVVQTFAKEKSGISILLQIDNSTAVAYINRRRGTASLKLSQLTKDL